MSYSAIREQRAREHELYSEWKVLPIVTLTSIATVIGSGILALPVTMYHTSLTRFIIMFTVSLFAQFASVYAVTELFQRSVAENADDNPPLIDFSDNADEESALANPASAAEHEKPSLTGLVNLYLPVWLQIIFHISTFASLMAMLISYGLAGPQALWELFHSPSALPTPPPMALYLAYSAVTIAGVLFFLNFLLPVFSSLTAVKGALFTAVVAIVASLPRSFRSAGLWDLLREPPFPIEAMGAPFLMATVALGGLPNTMPVTYALLPSRPTPAQVLNFRRAVVLALVLSYLLNVGWVIAVLQVVPRDGASNSLAEAFNKGLISTVPLIASLYAKEGVDKGMLDLIEVLVELFIVVSTAVSFFVIAAGLRSYIDGIVSDVWAFLQKKRQESWMSKKALFVLWYGAVFGAIVYMILANPHGFISILTRLCSLFMNIQSGLLLFLMLYNARKMAQSYGPARRQGQEELPLIMAGGTYVAITWFGSLFFGVACTLAIVGPFFGIHLGSAPHE